MEPKVRYVPRWVAETLVIPAGRTIIASPTIFSNQEVWPASLGWLAVTGDFTHAAGQEGAAQATGGVGRRLTWEVAIAQEGEINLVAGGTDAFFGLHRHQAYSVFDDGLRFGFPMEYELAPDAGLLATVSALDTSYSIDNPAIVLNGVRNEGRGYFEPAQLAAVIEDEVSHPSSVEFIAADLFNSGKSSIHVKEMLLKSNQLVEEGQGTAFKPQLNKVGWRVNPTNDVLWMPQDELIPAGNIAPFNRGIRDLWDEGPKAYVFPTGTMLRPRQRLTIRITNTDSTIAGDSVQTIVLSMFMLLEVQ